MTAAAGAVIAEVHWHDDAVHLQDCGRQLRLAAGTPQYGQQVQPTLECVWTFDV